MALEIERRFLVDPSYLTTDIFRDLQRNILTQVYLSKPEDSLVVRVRRNATTYTGHVTIKQHVAPGVNEEYEYEIPYDNATEIINKNKDTLVGKLRYIYPLGSLKVEVDSFGGRFSGIVIAEIEVPSLDYKIDIPGFCGKEITGIKGLSNFAMAFEPEKVIQILKELKD